MPFITENFLLKNRYAETLYHEYASNQPILDYHCHLPIKDIAEDNGFRNAAHLWLGGDHYKWRLLRAAGVPEQEITGNADDYQKFFQWARILPRAIGNPLFHWTQLELKRYFDIDDILSEKTAEQIWGRMNERISNESFTARKLIENSNVYALCTTDDPADDLSAHQQVRVDSGFQPILAPAFRPDKAVKITQEGFSDWLQALEKVADMEIGNLQDFLDALQSRLEAFHAAGCRIADFAMDICIMTEYTLESAAKTFLSVLEDRPVQVTELHAYQSFMITWLGREYAKRNWTMQLHIGALRNTNSKHFTELGADTGFDSIHDAEVALPLVTLLDTLDRDGLLPKTILYCLNPKDNEVLAAITGNYPAEGITGKVQFGSGWWFNDHLDGMRRQMTALANVGLLSNFVGMLTDSRSFISYPRHEYFRRILCQLIGAWVENGEYPWDEKLLGEIVADISFNNARDYFMLS